MSSETAKTQVVVLGAGVIGLTAAYVLSENPSYKIKVVARDMPEDLDSQGFASPWAGANWSPMGEYNPRIFKWEKKTFDKFWSMIPAGLAIASPSRVFYGEGKDIENLWYKDLVREFRVLQADEIPPSRTRGVGFKTVSVCPTFYLPWLKNELVSRGVEFERMKVASFGEAVALAGPGGVLINATALGARSLIGLEDTDVYPIRGQTIVIDNPKVREFISEELGASGDGNATYIIPRPSPTSSGFTTILGGKYQKDNWDTSFSADDARGILARCTALCPAIADPETRILRHNVGLRPARKGGPRVEPEWVDIPRAMEWLTHETHTTGELNAKGKVLVVHAYGFGPAGYQMSWGAAEEVGELVETNLKSA